MVEMEHWADQMIAAAIIAATRMAGSLPGNLQGVVLDKNSSKQAWRDELREFFTSSTNTDFTWSQPDRRFSGSRFILPSEIPDGIKHFGAAIDFSSSINLVWLNTFLGECQGMLDTGIIDKLTVALFHTEVFQSFEFNRGDTIEIDTAERGGTLFAPVFEWFRENAPDIAGLVMFTDLKPWEDWSESYGGVALNDVKPDCPTLFAVYGEIFTSKHYIERHARDADFGRCLPLWDID
jgi:predicted metal-dependent peptidase